MNKKFYIKNIECNHNILIINKNKVFYTDNIKNKNNFKNDLYNFDISHLYKIKNNIFSFNMNNILFYLIFSNKYSDSALFFNIVIKYNKIFYLLKFENYNIILKNKQKLIKYPMKSNNINNYKFIKNKSFIFYFSYKNLNLCKIKLNNKQNIIRHYVKIPIIRNDIETKNISYCKLNNDNPKNIPPIDDTDINCTFLKNISNKNNNKLDKCIISKNNYIIKEIPHIKKIIMNLLEKKNIINAGKIDINLTKHINNINNTIKNSVIADLTNELKYTLDDSYKLILSETVNDFSSYLIETNINSKTHNIKDLSNAYKNILLDIKERSDEYKLVKKYNICRDIPIKTYCPIKNLLSCQKICNNDDNCRFISYNQKNKRCRLFNKCNPKTSYNYITFVKKSLLRNDGYSWINRFYLLRNSPISQKPLWIDILLFIAIIIFIISLISIGSRLFITIYKFIYCFYYSDMCYFPTELLTLNENNNKYI